MLAELAHKVGQLGPLDNMHFASIFKIHVTNFEGLPHYNIFVESVISSAVSFLNRAWMLGNIMEEMHNHFYFPLISCD